MMAPYQSDHDETSQVFAWLGVALLAAGGMTIAFGYGGDAPWWVYGAVGPVIGLVGIVFA
jgi:fatty acid desaturase